MRLRIILAARPRWRGRYIFLILAIACLGLYGYTYLERVAYQSYEGREFDRTLVSRSGAGPRPATPKGRSWTCPTVRASRKTKSSIPIIGRLSVPRLHLSAMVSEGIDGNTLNLAIGHIPMTALPGQAGNVGVAGHRDTFFRPLKDLRTNDEIQFSTPDGTFVYEVESIVVVEPEDVGVLASSGENVLTMVTCYPFSYIGAAPKRFVVRARQVSAGPPAGAGLNRDATRQEKGGGSQPPCRMPSCPTSLASVEKR